MYPSEVCRLTNFVVLAKYHESFWNRKSKFKIFEEHGCQILLFFFFVELHALNFNGPKNKRGKCGGKWLMKTVNFSKLGLGLQFKWKRRTEDVGGTHSSFFLFCIFVLPSGKLLRT